MFVLTELPEGLALFKVADKDASDAARIARNFGTADAVAKVARLKAFREFANMDEAVEVNSSIMDRTELSPALTAFLAEQISAGDVLHCGDSHLAKLITDKFGVTARASVDSSKIIRGIRMAAIDLVDGVSDESSRRMAIALSHALCRYRLRCGTDKVDVMIMQAVSILDDTEKEINTYTMRLKEWYGWHWPELVSSVADPLTYATIAVHFGMRGNVTRDALEADIGLEPELAETVAYKAGTSMGFEVTPENMLSIQAFAQQIVDLCNYRTSLNEFLEERMNAVAPGVTALVGVNVGARLISEAGSLLSLAKAPASTVQLLGAAKSLFRALKKKSPTPKFGVLYHAKFVQQASSTRAKGRMARTLAAKTALVARLDALATADSDTEREAQGASARAWAESIVEGVQARLAALEGVPYAGAAGANRGREDFKKYTTGVAPRAVGGDDLVGIAPGAARAAPEPVAEVAEEEGAEETAQRKPEVEAEAEAEAEKPKEKKSKDKKSKDKKSKDKKSKDKKSKDKKAEKKAKKSKAKKE